MAQSIISCLAKGPIFGIVYGKANGKEIGVPFGGYFDIGNVEEVWIFIYPNGYVFIVPGVVLRFNGIEGANFHGFYKYACVMFDSRFILVCVTDVIGLGEFCCFLDGLVDDPVTQVGVVCTNSEYKCIIGDLEMLGGFSKTM